MSRSSLPWLAVGHPFAAQVAAALAQSSPEKRGALVIGMDGHQDPRWASSAIAKAHASGQRLTARGLSEAASRVARAGVARTRLAYCQAKRTLAIAANRELASFPLSPEGDNIKGGFLWKSSR
jgi:hypothetical protein